MLVKAIGNQTEYFEEVYQIVLKDEFQVSNRAAWVLSLTAEQNPKLAVPYFKDMVNRVDGFSISGIRRSLLKVLLHVKWPEDEDILGGLTEKCFTFLENENEPVAIRSYAMMILYQVCKIYPDLKYELSACIEKNKPTGSVGFRMQAKKILMELKKL